MAHLFLDCYEKKSRAYDGSDNNTGAETLHNGVGLQPQNNLLT